MKTCLSRLLVLVWLGCAMNGSSDTIQFAAGTTQLRIEMVSFDGGEFLMGCPSNPPAPWGFDERSTEHKVVLSPFSIGKYPVTFEQYCQFLNTEGFQQDYTREEFLFTWITVKDRVYITRKGFQSHAVSGITFQGALAFCDWVSRKTGATCRLPTEAEWEFVAKGKQGRTYPWGEKQLAIPLLGDPVGNHPELATPEGVHDLNGPAYQWCLDVFDSRFYSISPLKDPVCKTGGSSRVGRGGPMMRHGLRNVQMVFPATWERFSVKDYPAKNRLPCGFRIVVERTQERAGGGHLSEPKNGS